jgi:hypothetical protein
VNKPLWVELLRSYSKQQRPEIAAISVLDEARRDQKRAPNGQTPSEIRNTKQARERVRILDQHEVDELVDCYLAGDSTYTLSRRFGIRRDTVVAHLKRRGIMRRANGLIVLDVNEGQQVIELLRHGWSVRRVAATRGHSERVIARTLDEASMERHRINTPSARASQ